MRHVRLELPAIGASATQARHGVSAILQNWKLEPPVIEVAALVVTELVANAAANVGGSVLVSVTVDADVLRIGAADGAGSVLPRRMQPDAQSESGRGVWLIDALTHRWGVAATDRTKEVWAELDLDRATSSEPDGDRAAGAALLAVGAAR